MSLLGYVVLAFVFLELSNVAALYFAPQTRRANAMGVFEAYEGAKAHPGLHRLVRYLTFWVAGTKLIFLGLLLVIVFLGGPLLLQVSVGVLILTIGTYFWRLHPLIREMDAAGELAPQGYSKTLGKMILGFELVFTAALLWGVFAAP
ncbi:MAG: hypothetical protein P1V51_09555 [Deltaproteobacteria bacterium]|nr:hypothetical protein [Deltaproteobacteria bacterium]